LTDGDVAALTQPPPELIVLRIMVKTHHPMITLVVHRSFTA
jgi:hypothetical protein